MPTPVPTPVPVPSPVPTPVPTPVPVPSPVPSVHESSSSKPSEGTQVIDVEELIRQIQEDDGEKISDLASTQKAVLKCLGLLG